MSRLRHPNIITLVGYCAQHGQRLLVYEYIGIGTLHDMLHFADDSIKTLIWNARVKVALGTARALEYLREVCLPSVVHRKLKTGNILLDEDLNPHLTDCGLAALAPNTERQVSTQMVGSFGYSAPEFAMPGIYNVKSDVYSFGVVMLDHLVHLTHILFDILTVFQSFFLLFLSSFSAFFTDEVSSFSAGRKIDFYEICRRFEFGRGEKFIKIEKARTHRICLSKILLVVFLLNFYSKLVSFSFSLIVNPCKFSAYVAP